MNTFRKLLAMTLVIVLAFSLSACSEATVSTTGGNTGGASSGGKKIGVAMPTNDLQRWNQDGEYLKAEFEAAGHELPQLCSIIRLSSDCRFRHYMVAE